MSEAQLEKLCADANEALRSGKYEQGKQLFRQALEEGENADVHFGLATCFFVLQDLNSALKHFHRVTQLDPTRATSFINIGAIYNRAGQQDKAIEWLERGLKVDPDRAEGHYNLGIAYKSLGILDLAIGSHQRATELNPRMFDAFFNLGNVLLETQQPEDALKAYQAALKLKPGFEKAQSGLDNALAIIHANQIEAEEANISKPFQSEKDRTDSIQNLHQSLQNQEESCKVMCHVLEEDLNQAQRELSRCLVGKPNDGELEMHADAFARALDRVVSAKKTLSDGLNQIQRLRNRFQAEMDRNPI